MNGMRIWRRRLVAAAMAGVVAASVTIGAGLAAPAAGEVTTGQVTAGQVTAAH